MLTAALFALAVAAGLTGAWSPCGFSMVETARGPVARLSFALGALAGGVVTFAALALLGSALGAGGPAALTAAALVAIAAAAGEARGARITPQIRRQVPESWRRILPLPLATAGYGVLLGLAFTTFVLSFAVWALAALCVAVGDPQLGVIVGLAFGGGRALPVLALSPGGVLHTAMAERPAIYRGLRLADALALVACAGALVTTDAHAATRIHIAPATDPTSTGSILTWQQPGGSGHINRFGRTDALPGNFPTLGGGLVGWREGERVVFADPVTLEPRTVAFAPGLGPFAFNERWLAYLAPGGEAMAVRSLTESGRPDRVVALVDPPASLGRPVLAGDRLLFHVAGRRSSRIEEHDLQTGAARTVRRSTRTLLLNPAVHGERLAYVRSAYTRQELRLGPLLTDTAARDATLYSTVPTARRDLGREPGRERHSRRRLPRRPPAGTSITLWTTALDERHAYVTRLVARRGLPLSSSVLRSDRPLTRRGRD